MNHKHMPPIAFFGLSGVGKTTLAHKLVKQYSSLFFLARITTSRAPRDDDDPLFVEYALEKDFLTIANEPLAISWCQDHNYYGYRETALAPRAAHPVLTCSLSAIQIVKEFGAITVLVQGDAEKGLEARGSPSIRKKRMELNRKNRSLYVEQEWFIGNVDIIHNNSWDNLDQSVTTLYESIQDYLYE